MNEAIERPPAFKPETTSEERTWAAIAHASTVVTILATFASAGIAALVLPFVPLVIYLSFKDRSRYVAEQAAQAFAAQLMATLGFLVVAIVAVVVILLAWIITGLLSIILIGLVLIPVALLVTLALALALVVYPFIIMGVSFIATIETANGKAYRVPYIGTPIVDWITQRRPPATERREQPPATEEHIEETTPMV